MIFQRSLLREFTTTGIATFFVLLAITITTQLIRFLGYAARGNISSDAVLTFLGFASLRYLPHLSYRVRHNLHTVVCYEVGIGWSFPSRLDEASWYASRPSSFPGTTGRHRYR